MIKPYLNNLIYSLLPVLFFLTSCMGQNKTQPQANKNEQKINITSLPKILKPQSAFKDASICCGLRDKAGNLWFASNGEGIYRYNGKTFTHFTEKDGLDNNIVYSIFEDKAGNIWVGTQTGLCKYNGKIFTPISIDTYVPNFNSNNSVSPTSQNAVWNIMQDKSGKIWFGTNNGIYCYNGISFTRFLDNTTIINKDNLHLKGVFSIIEDKKGNMWFGSCVGEGLIRFDGKTLSRVSPKGYARTQYIEEDKNGNIWFASIGKGLCMYDGKTINTNFFTEKETYDVFYYIWKDKVGNIWFCDPLRDRPLCYYDGKDKINFIEKNSIKDKKICPLLEDTNGNIWFASTGMHLYKFDGKAFSSFSE